MQAQEADWSYSANIYGWIPGLDGSVNTPLGELDSKSNGSNVLDNLDMAFMGSFEARRNRWGFLVDGIYAKLLNEEGYAVRLGVFRRHCQNRTLCDFCLCTLSQL